MIRFQISIVIVNVQSVNRQLQARADGEDLVILACTVFD